MTCDSVSAPCEQCMNLVRAAMMDSLRHNCPHPSMCSSGIGSFELLSPERTDPNGLSADQISPH